jgi:hypothetical protein
MNSPMQGNAYSNPGTYSVPSHGDQRPATQDLAGIAWWQDTAPGDNLQPPRFSLSQHLGLQQLTGSPGPPNPPQQDEEDSGRPTLC